MADTLFPKREERVPYGSGTPAKRDRKNTKGKKTGRTNRNKPTEKKRGKKDGKKLNRNALYLIGIHRVSLCAQKRLCGLYRG